MSSGTRRRTTSSALAGLVAMELSRGDGSLATFAGVQAGLVMQSIARFGSEEQKARWLGPLARAADLLEARDLLGGNGILIENHVMRHLADVEAIHTYEGTETIQTLLVGRDITGVGAFT